MLVARLSERWSVPDARASEVTAACQCGSALGENGTTNSGRRDMKRIFAVAGVLAASLFLARLGHATPGWVQLPGLATQIAVGANDIPYVLDINGYVQYLA